jgi:cell division protein FtsB
VKPWPKADDFGYAFDELSAKDAALRFQRARADAAMERLRVAVEALQEAVPALHDGGHHAMAEQAEEALQEIGELPPECS